jgi:hypothetical protein
LLGHFRHEIAHYYWGRLVADSAKLDEFRQIFGDERADYTQALQRYYASGAPGDWSQHFVSAYAAAHPWEDFAETWAHYFHMIDTLQTAGSFGLAVAPRASKVLGARVDFDAHRADMGRLIEAWIPVTFAANSNESEHGSAGPLPIRAEHARRGEAYLHPCAHPRPSGTPSSVQLGVRAMIARLRRRTAISKQS